MAFVNEYIPAEDFERFGLQEIDKRQASAVRARDWTVGFAINDTGRHQQDGSLVAAGTLLFVVQGQDPSDPPHGAP